MTHEQKLWTVTGCATFVLLCFGVLFMMGMQRQAFYNSIHGRWLEDSQDGCIMTVAPDNTYQTNCQEYSWHDSGEVVASDATHGYVPVTLYGQSREIAIRLDGDHLIYGDEPSNHISVYTRLNR